jgi:hypothetical protein
MARRSILVAIGVVCFLTLAAGAARAQDRSANPPADPLVFGTGATYEVKFDDDPLAALPNGVLIPRITVREGWPHAQLMRPRTHFVNEMLKSTDTL